jgi:hypothetical protein
VDRPGLNALVGCQARIINVEDEGYYVDVLDEVALHDRFAGMSSTSTGWFVTEVSPVKVQKVPTFVDVAEANAWLEANA